MCHNLPRRNSVGLKLCRQFAQSLQRQLLSLPVWRVRPRPIDDHRSALSLQVQPSFVGEHPVGLGDGIEMNAQIHGQLPYRRHQIARLQCPIDEVTPHAIDNLAVNGNHRIRIDCDNGRPVHLSIVYIQYTNIVKPAVINPFDL
jgi:hypothetical protein